MHTFDQFMYQGWIAELGEIRRDAEIPDYDRRMITAMHSLVYADDPQAARTFFVDVLEWPHVDAGDGWLIFKTGPSELGVHPTSTEWEGQTWTAEQHHQLALMCDDLEATVADLESKGTEFTSGIEEAPWGRVITLKVPGAGEMMLYQPLHQTAYDL